MRVLHPIPPADAVLQLGQGAEKATLVWSMTLMAETSRKIVERQAQGRGLAQTLLTAIDGQKLQIETDFRGKPLVAGRADRYVSISHSGDVLVAAAGTAGPIGIDIERHKASRNIDAIAEAAFGPGEREAVRREGPAAFYRIWTIREAFAKATGEGMASVTDRRDRVPPELPAGMMVAIEDDWMLGYQRIDENLSWAIAIRASHS